MGKIKYADETIGFDDRVLAHLQIVIVTKLRNNEAFLMSWLDALSSGDGRSSIWLEPHAEIYFKFAGSKVPAIDRRWLERLRESANSSTGLIVTDADGNPIRSTQVSLKA